MKSLWRDGDRQRETEVRSLGEGRFLVRVDEAEFTLSVEVSPDGRMRLRGEAGDAVAEVTASGSRRFVRLGTLEFVLDRESSTRKRVGGAHGGNLEAPMPGVVTRLMVAPGDEVTKGQPLVAIEAMKMEHLIRAPRDGRVARVDAAIGVLVQGGVALVALVELKD